MLARHFNILLMAIYKVWPYRTGFFFNKNVSYKSNYIKKEYKINFVKVLRFPLFADSDVQLKGEVFSIVNTLLEILNFQTDFLYVILQKFIFLFFFCLDLDEFTVYSPHTSHPLGYSASSATQQAQFYHREFYNVV